MRATATCPACKTVLTSDCGGCVISGISYHKCNGKQKVVAVNWKKLPASEKEELENYR